MDVKLLHLFLDDGVVVPEYEAVVLRLVLRDSHLGVGVVLKLEVVPVEMVRRYVEQDGDVGVEVVHVVELERAQLYDVVVVWVFRHLQREASPYVPGQSGVVARLLEDVVYERCRRGLAV